MTFFFTPEPKPFRLWLGPFVAARGWTADFRVRSKKFGAIVRTTNGERFWSAVETRGLKQMTALVCANWSGGRVLLLPDGHVVKPLQEEDERGRRVLIGRYRGAFALRKTDGSQFDLGTADDYQPGSPWLGPSSIGLECKIQEDGSLHCTWWQHLSHGAFERTMQVCGPDRELFRGFRAARPGMTRGRVLVTISGHVITKNEIESNDWRSVYVGRIDLKNWIHDPSWIGANYA